MHPEDARRRVFRLTPKGQELQPTLNEIWTDLARAQLAAFETAGWDVMAQLEQIEQELERQSICGRVLALRRPS